jgi:hypothetical protein
LNENSFRIAHLSAYMNILNIVPCTHAHSSKPVAMEFLCKRIRDSAIGPVWYR